MIRPWRKTRNNELVAAKGKGKNLHTIKGGERGPFAPLKDERTELPPRCGVKVEGGE